MNTNGDERKGAPGNNRVPRANWRTQAACRDFRANNIYDPWDANPTDRNPSQTAASYCKKCPVQRECLLAGLESDRMNQGQAYGVWGGLAPGQRRAITRARYRVGCPVCKGDLLISPEGEEWQACARCGVTWKTRVRKPLNL